MNNMHSAPADEFYVANLFADGMIVPRDKPIVTWGRAPLSQNGRTVSAEFRGLRGFVRTSEGVDIVYRYAGGGLKTADGAPVTGFEVLEGGKWIPAPAKISGDRVTVVSPGAAGVRYASALRYTPDDLPNLCSGTGNIAVPFCRMLR